MAEFKVLLVGSGGREYAFLRKLLQSPDVKVTVAPGLSGMLYFLSEEQRSRVELKPQVKANDIKAIVELAEEIKPDLVVVGPEDPLILGLADELQKVGFKVFGFTKTAATLEGSKRFCKEIYQKLKLPTAPAEYFTRAEAAIQRLEWYEQNGQPVVLKCDNPALGKGVIVVPLSHPGYWQELKSQVRLMFDPKMPLGFLAKAVLLEDQFHMLNEWSAMSIVGPNNFWLGLAPTKDHKELNGKNTGGMGIVTMAPGFSYDDMLKRKPLVRQVAEHMSDYHKTELCGIFYEGLNRMMGGVDYLVEINVRGGDPETQGQLEFIEGAPLHEILLAAVEGKPEILSRVRVPEDKVLVGVVMASKGYPGAYEKGKVITMPKELPVPGMIFSAGLAWEEGKLYTAGGRVLMAVGEGKTVSSARNRAYAIVNSIKHDGALVWREDIGIAA
ncbi:MAG: hypothetical protein NTX00_02965 [Candidatus Parcubacteria bacterium]|nr:hypothetical protein [Candidatus Parcubacteria bacterium]